MTCLAQLTDLHLQADTQAMYRGVCPDQHWQQCLQWLAQQPQIHRLLLTGDLSDDASPQAYARLQASLQAQPLPCHWLPGNHDVGSCRKYWYRHEDEYYHGVSKVRWLQLPPWRLILLDSTHAPDGKGGGSLASTDVLHLDDLLASAPLCPTLVGLHHNPIPVHHDRQDPMMLHNVVEFRQVMERHCQVQAVLFGHIHQTLDRLHHGVRYLGSPAVSVQFAHHQGTLQRQNKKGPGLRLLHLYDDGSLQTQVVHLSELMPEKESLKPLYDPFYSRS